jgi:hypothetical protein
MNSITILDGGLFDYKGDTANDNKLNGSPSDMNQTVD